MSKPKILQTSCGVLYLKPSQRFVGETRATIRLLRLGLRILFKACPTTNTAEILLKLPRGRVMSLSLHHRMATFQNCNHVPDAIDLGSCWRKKAWMRWLNISHFRRISRCIYYESLVWKYVEVIALLKTSMKRNTFLTASLGHCHAMYLPFVRLGCLHLVRSCHPQGDRKDVRLRKN